MHEAFAVPRRQELLGLIIFFVENVRKFVRVLFGLIAGAAISPKLFTYLWVAVVAGVVINATFSWLQYRRFLFHVDGGALRITKGVLVRENITIPFDRIQTVHLHQNVIQRILSLTGVKVDTAGSGKKELQIHALKRGEAQALQRILQHYALVDGRPAAPSASEEDAQAVSEVPTAPGETLVELSLGRLLLVGLTQNHIRNGLVAVGFVVGTFSQFDNWVEQAIDQIDEDTLAMARAFVLASVLGGVLVFLTASVLFSIVQVVLRYYGLKASLSSQSFTVVAGLLKRNEHTIPLRKVQFLEWRGNFLRRIPGFETLRIVQGRSQENVPGTMNVSIPAVFPEQTARIVEQVFEGQHEGPAEVLLPHGYARYLRFAFVLLPLVFPLIPLLIGGFNPWLVGGMVAYTGLVWMWTGKYHRSVSLESNGHVLVYQRGWAFTVRTVMHLHKLQRIQIRQNFLHRHRGVAHVTLFTAGGSRTVRYLSIDQARELYDYALYRVESFKGSWM
ncbi:MAG: PH domain-containing protein [Flavobacteriales bacterium]